MSMSLNDLNNVLTGISDSDLVFYSVGGTVLAVISGFWGFRKVHALLSDSSSSSRSDIQKKRDYQFERVLAQNTDRNYSGFNSFSSKYK